MEPLRGGTAPVLMFWRSVTGTTVFRRMQMGLIRLRIRELADQRGWTLKEVAERSGLSYSTVKSYVQREAMNTTDYTAIHRLARAFGVAIEDLVEILEE